MVGTPEEVNPEEEVRVTPLLAPLVILRPCHFNDACSSVSFPSLSLRPSMRQISAYNTSPSKRISYFDEMAAARLSSRLHVKKEDVEKAPKTMLRNLVLSFRTMIESRLRLTLSSLERKAMRAGSMKEARAFKIITKCYGKPLIEFTDAKLEIRALSEGAKVIAINEIITHQVTSVNFECTFEVRIFGKYSINISITTPGKSYSSIDNLNGLFTMLDMKLDTLILVGSMKKHCEHVIRTAVALAYV
jgi:hypothetical protein